MRLRRLHEMVTDPVKEAAPRKAAANSARVRYLSALCGNQPQRHAMLPRPLIQRLTRELRTLIGPHHLWQAVELACALQSTRDALAAGSVADDDVEGLLR